MAISRIAPFRRTATRSDLCLITSKSYDLHHRESDRVHPAGLRENSIFALVLKHQVPMQTRRKGWRQALLQKVYAAADHQKTHADIFFHLANGHYVGACLHLHSVHLI